MAGRRFFMQNPAINLLKPKQAIKARGKMKGKAYFFVLGTILVLIFFIAILGLSSRQYLKNLSDENYLTHLLPANTQIFASLNVDREHNHQTAQLFESYDRLAEKLGLPTGSAQIQNLFKNFSSRLDDTLLRDGETLTWIKFDNNSTDQQLLALKMKNEASTSNILKEKFLSTSILYQGVSLWRATTEEKNFYYLFLDHYVFFSQNESGLKTIIDLKSNPSGNLENNANFRKVQAQFPFPSPLFVYLNLGNILPSGIGLVRVDETRLELQAYYSMENKISLNKPEASWLRFIPNSPLLVAYLPASDMQYILGENSLQNLFLSFLDPDEIIRKNLEASDKMEELKSLALGNLELIVDRDTKDIPTTTLILSQNQADKTAFEKLTAILRKLAAANQPKEEEATLPDGSKITEYVLPDEALPEQKEIAGIPANIITLAPDHHLFYGYLDEKLIISNSEETFQKVISSFRTQQENPLQRSFTGAREWFFLDSEKLTSLGFKSPFIGFKNIQSIGTEAGDGILIHLYLGI